MSKTPGTTPETTLKTKNELIHNDGRVVDIEESNMAYSLVFNHLKHAIEYGLMIENVAQLGTSLTFERITATEICWTYHSGPKSYCECSVDGRRCKIYIERFTCTGTEEQLAPFHELIHWAYHVSKLPHPITGERLEPNPQPGSRLPTFLLQRDVGIFTTRLQRYILEQYDFNKNDMKALRGKITVPGIAHKIGEAGEMWSEVLHTSLTFGQAIRDLVLYEEKQAG